MKCLVTGAAGFIGSNIAEALVKRGDQVRVLDNFSTGIKENLASFEKHIELVTGDIRNVDDVAKAVKGIDVIFHEGALRSVERSVDNPLATNDVNITGTLNLLMGARKAGVKRLVYASSSSVYGDNKKYPQSETFRPSPVSPYAVAKLTAEQYCVVFAKTFGLETVALRYFNVFGPRQHPESQYATVIPKFMQSAYRGEPLQVHWDGKQSRDFTYIENVIQANFIAAVKPGISGEVFNIARGENYSLLDIIRALEKIVGRKLQREHFPMRTGDVRKTYADIRKAKKLMGYSPRIGLAEGLAKTWEWFKLTQGQELRV